MSTPARSLHAPHALLPQGWAAEVRLDIGADGNILAVTRGAPADGAERLAGPAIPGMPDVHSHAFQRAMAGLAERAGPGTDSFWTWRERMYGFVARLAPDDAHAVASQLCVELLKAGYTVLGEFHYLHRDADGRAYANPAEMSLAHVRAARETGIAITHLPVLYAYSDFGERPLRAEQRRFRGSSDEVLAIASAVQGRFASDPDVVVGIAPHSLRAVSPAMLRDVVAGTRSAGIAGPIHIHAAEQVKEVHDALAALGARPVEWLLANADVDERWCIVHATQLAEHEVRALAASGAVAGLCPTTEANLGDGLFPLKPFLDAGGRIAIGSDSNVSRDPAEELRCLEYGQRLARLERNVAATPGQPSVGTRLWTAAAEGGAQALGRRAGAIEAGRRADIVVLDAAHPDLAARDADALLDTLVFSSAVGRIRDVMVGGRWAVRDGRHPHEAEIAAAYASAVKRLVGR